MDDEFGVSTAYRANSKAQEKKIRAVQEVFAEIPKDRIAILLNHFDQSVLHVLESLTDGRAAEVLNNWDREAQLTSKSKKKKKEKKREPEETGIAKEQSSKKAAESTPPSQQQPTTAGTDNPATVNENGTRIRKPQKQRRPQAIKLDPIKVVLDQAPLPQPTVVAPPISMPPGSGMKRIDISDLLAITPASIQRTLIQQQRALLQQDDEPTPESLASASPENAVNVQVVRPPQDILDTDLADHPASLGLKAADSVLHEMEENMTTQWELARDHVRTAFLRIAQAMSMRETAITRDIERQLYREVQLLSRRKAMLNQLKDLVRKSFQVTGEVPTDIIMKIEEFKTCSELDLPNWRHGRFYASPEQIGVQIEKLGVLYNAADGLPPSDEHLLTQPVEQPKQKPETIKLNLPTALLRGPDPTAGKDNSRNRKKDRQKKANANDTNDNRGKATGGKQQQKQQNAKQDVKKEQNTKQQPKNEKSQTHTKKQRSKSESNASPAEEKPAQHQKDSKANGKNKKQAKDTTSDKQDQPAEQQQQNKQQQKQNAQQQTKSAKDNKQPEKGKGDQQNQDGTTLKKKNQKQQQKQSKEQQPNHNEGSQHQSANPTTGSLDSDKDGASPTTPIDMPQPNGSDAAEKPQRVKRQRRPRGKDAKNTGETQASTDTKADQGMTNQEQSSSTEAQDVVQTPVVQANEQRPKRQNRRRNKAKANDGSAASEHNEQLSESPAQTEVQAGDEKPQDVPSSTVTEPTPEAQTNASTPDEEGPAQSEQVRSSDQLAEQSQHAEQTLQPEQPVEEAQQATVDQTEEPVEEQQADDIAKGALANEEESQQEAVQAEDDGIITLTIGSAEGKSDSPIDRTTPIHDPTSLNF
eukprot:m.149169 g.149169  ORF g.149169 m.149169 type:complete len:866 (-) comp16154_c0_seq2:377-2974(-)